MIHLHTLKGKHGARMSGRGVLGRGASSGFGTTAGRGTKGQRARSGSRKGLKIFGSKAMILTLPKMRGFKSPTPKAVTISCAQLQRVCADGTIVTLAELVKCGLARARTNAKIVAGGELKKKFTVRGVAITPAAITQITAAGGVVETHATEK